LFPKTKKESAHVLRVGRVLSQTAQNQLAALFTFLQGVGKP
jgi:hypothetical protein